MRRAVLACARTHSRRRSPGTNSAWSALIVLRRRLHLDRTIGSKAVARKQNELVEEGRQYNYEFIAKIVRGLGSSSGRSSATSGGVDYFVRVLRLCAELKDVAHGRQIHEHLVQMGIAENPQLASYIFEMYLKCGCIDEAFESARGMPLNDLVLWTTMMAAYAERKQWQEVLRLFDLMELYCLRPARITYFGVIKAHASPECLSGARLMHKRLADNGADSEELIKAALVDMYSKCGSFEDARSVFEGVHPSNSFAMDAMVAACVHHGYYRLAFELFETLVVEYSKVGRTTFAAVLGACTRAEDLGLGKRLHVSAAKEGYDSDLLVVKALVGMYSRCGGLQDAVKLFGATVHRDAEVWSTVVSAYAKHGRCTDGFRLLQGMQSKGLVVDAGSAVAFLAACGSLLAVDEGRVVHRWIVTMGLGEDVGVAAALVDMYCKCGALGEARVVLRDAGKSGFRAWNSMLAGYTDAGYGFEATELFSEMVLEGFSPDTTTFNSLIRAFGHIGFVEEGIGYFTSMRTDFGVQPTRDHYAGVVSVLGQRQLLPAVEDFVHRLPEFDAVIWEAFLDASRVHGDTERATVAAEKLLELGCRTPGPYVVLSGIYESEGKSEVAEGVKNLMVERGVTEERVVSSILIRGASYHEFGTGDRSHRLIERINAEFEFLEVEHNKKLDLHDVGEEGRHRGDGCVHSEMLAIGLGLLKTAAGSPLRIIKNGRMCVDCHLAFETVSKLENRLVVVRARGKLHVFTEGICSCNDYH